MQTSARLFLHGRAHRLEHVHDDESVGYLDDLLGHPITDPHGSEIPENPSDCSPGATCSVSMLRQGRRGRITSIGKNAERTGLKAGQEISVGARQENGSTWMVIVEGLGERSLDHEAADNVFVEVSG